MNKTIRLIWQLYPTYLLITLIALGAVSMYAANFLGDYFYERTLADLESQGRIVKVLVARHFEPLDAAAIDQHCKKIGKSTPTRVTVILPDGTVIGDSEENPEAMDNHRDRPEIRMAAAGKVGSSQRYSRTLDKRMLYLALPFKMGDDIRGIIRTSVASTDIDAELGRIQSNIALGGFLIAILAAVICYFASRRISQPIENLRKGAENFAKGNLDDRLPIPITRETAGLAKAMNDMASQLEHRRKVELDQRNEMQAILSSMTEGVIAMDMDQHILSFNQAAAGIITELNGISKGQLLQEAVRNLPLQHLIERALEGNPSVTEDIILYQTAQRILNIHATPIHNARQARIGTLLVLNDVTQLRYLEKMRQDFVANVSHEIKTPLTAIKGFIETLQNGAKERPEEADRFFSIIEKHANRLEAIIDDLLHLSRIEKENETKQIEFATHPIDNLLRSCLQICQAKADAKQIGIEMFCDDALTATINAALLEQALINLIDNAIKYSEKNSNVIITTLKSPSEITIQVKDNGIGIPKKHLPRLFERFYRADKARSRELGGTGLGLAIVKHIVAAHGGHVTVETQQGKGSTFTIHLPC